LKRPGAADALEGVQGNTWDFHFEPDQWLILEPISAANLDFVLVAFLRDEAVEGGSQGVRLG
jgi:hypothetical protein